MKKTLLSLPVLGLISRALPAKRRPGVGALLFLKFLPGWALTAFLAAFVWSWWSKPRSRKPEYSADSY